MMKHLLLAVSVLALTSGGVFAQGYGSSPAQSPAMPPPAAGTGGSSSGAGSMGQAPESGATSQAPESGTATQAPESGTTSQAPESGTMGQTPESGAMSHSPSHAAVRHSPAMVREAQRMLKRDGLYKGKVDGKFGPETRAAVVQFQKQNGLKQTAQLDSRTMSKLKAGGGGGTSGGSHY